MNKHDIKIPVISDQTFAQARAVYWVLRHVDVDALRCLTDEAIVELAAEKMAGFGGYSGAEAEQFIQAIWCHLIDHNHIQIIGWTRSLTE